MQPKVAFDVGITEARARGESSKILTLKQQKNRDRRFLPPLLPCILLTRRVQMRLGGRLRRLRVALQAGCCMR